MAKMQGLFIVVPSQFENENELTGIAVTKPGVANSMADDIQKAVRRIAAKHLGLSVKGLEKDPEKNPAQAKKRAEILAEIKAIPTIGLDILFQPLDKDGNPTGEAYGYDEKRQPVESDPDDAEDVAE